MAKENEKVARCFIATPYEDLKEAKDYKDILLNNLVPVEYDPVPVTFTKKVYETKSGTQVSYEISLLLHKLVKLKLKSKFINEATYNLTKLAFVSDVDKLEEKFTGFIRFLKFRNEKNEFTAVELLIHPDVMRISSYVDGSTIAVMDGITKKTKEEMEKLKIEPLKDYKIYKVKDSQETAVDFFNQASFETTEE